MTTDTSSVLYTEALAYLRAALGDPQAEFRDGQWDAIRAIIEDRGRQLVVQRTGWGKSLVYFAATRILRDQGAGFTLLVSPLLSLMRNQIEMADRLGLRAVSVNSTNPGDWNDIEASVRANDVDLLLVSPERLANDKFMTGTLRPVADRIGLFVVDEAHCISDWGHDFRPNYQRIRRMLAQLPPTIPVLATTATANDRVIADVRGQLGAHVGVQRGALARDSLYLQNINLPTPVARYAWLAENLPRIDGSGIIYTLTRRDAARVANWLRECGIDARAYMGGGDDNAELEQRLLNNDLKALVATSALGMGFDKPDLAFVIHFQRPQSVVHYYQQVGRAGRALEHAVGIMLSGAEDRQIGDYFINSAFPKDDDVQAVLEALKDAGDEGLSMTNIESVANLSRGKVEQILTLLAIEEPSPVTRDKSRWCATGIPYEIDRERINRLTELRVEEQERMEAYLNHDRCLMSFLRAELNDPADDLADDLDQGCGRCAICDPARAFPSEVAQDTAQRAATFLQRSDQPIEPRRSWSPAGDALARYGRSNQGWKGTIKPALRAEEGRALCHANDPGWGDLVRQGKETDEHFSDKLVDAARILYTDRWTPTLTPNPAPTWICCVPSLRHPDLVPAFAGRLAGALQLPFIPDGITKRRETNPQRDMVNSYHQVRNIAGAFEVDAQSVRDEPVLLIDDIVDSRWTLTIIAALLREVGVPAVYPLVLASRARG